MKKVEATVILSKCSKTHKTYGIRAEKKEDGGNASGKGNFNAAS